MSPKIAFVVGVILQVTIACQCSQQRTFVQRSPGYPTRMQVPKVRTVAPNVATVAAPCNSQVYTTRAPGQIISAPGQVISAPGQIISGPAQIISGPGQVISAPGQIISGPAQIISGPGQVISAPSQIISTPNQVISAPSQVISSHAPMCSGATQVISSSAPIAPYLPTTIVDNSVTNSLVDTLSLFIVSDLIQSSRTPKVAVSASPVLPPVNIVETIAPAPIYTTYETYSPVAPVVTETVTGYSPYGATTTFVDVAGPSYVEYATGYGPNLVETVSYGGVTEVLAPELMMPAQYTSYVEPLVSSYVAAPSCYY